MDLFVEVTNLTKGNTIWAYYTSTGHYSTSIRLSRQIPEEYVRISTSWCCFKTMHIDWEKGLGCCRVRKGRGKCLLLCAVTVALIKD